MSSAAVDDFTADSNGTPDTIQDAPAETPTETVVEAPIEQAPAEVEDTTDAADPIETPEQAEARARDEQGRFSKPSKTQERINKAIYAQRQAERLAAEQQREATYWRQQAERAQPTPPRSEAGSAGTLPASQGDAEPTFEQFAKDHPDHPDQFMGFTREMARWEARQIIRAEREAERQSQVAQSYDARLRKFQEDFGKFQAEPDFAAALDVVQHVPIKPELRFAILDAEDPAALALHLARHADEYDQLRNMTGAQLHRTLGRLETRLSAAPLGSAPQVSVTRANPPIKPVGSSPIVSDSPPSDRDSDDAHFEYWNRKDREAKRR